MIATTRAATRALRAGVGGFASRPAIEWRALAIQQAHSRAIDSVTTEAAPWRDTARVPKASGGFAAGKVSRTGSGHLDNN